MQYNLYANAGHECKRVTAVTTAEVSVLTRAGRNSIENNFQTNGNFRIWGFHTCGYEEYYLLRYKVVCSVEFQSTHWKTYRLQLQGPINRGRYQRESRLFEKFPPKRRINFKGLHGVICQITLLNGNLNPHTVATV